MAINPEQISNITKEAYSVLKNKALGGVSKESAQNAIEEAVRKAVQLGEEAVGKVQQEIQALKGKTAREIADITSQKDAFVYQTQQKAAKEIEEVIKKAKATKTAERVLPNGHKEVRKVNKNGAVMVKEYNEAGQLLKSNVTTLDGTIRRTSYNPVDGKPVKTFTNTTGKDTLIEYQQNGAAKMNRVNNKKVKPQKPTLVSQSQPYSSKNNMYGEEGQAIDRFYSDGSKETITRINNLNSNKIVSERFDANGNKVYDKTIFDNNYRVVREHTYKDDKIVSKETCDRRGTIYKSYETYTERMRNPSTGDTVITKAKYTDLNNNTVTKYKAIKDEFGFYTGKYEAKTVYPKTSNQAPSVEEVSGKEVPYIY